MTQEPLSILYSTFTYAVVVAEDELVIAKLDVAAPLEHPPSVGETLTSIVGQSTTKSGPQFEKLPEKELDVVEVLYRHLICCPCGTFIDADSVLFGCTAWLATNNVQFEPPSSEYSA